MAINTKRRFGQLGGTFDPREEAERKKREEEEERQRQAQAYHNYVRATSALGVDPTALQRKRDAQAYDKALDTAIERARQAEAARRDYTQALDSIILPRQAGSGTAREAVLGQRLRQIARERAAEEYAASDPRRKYREELLKLPTQERTQTGSLLDSMPQRKTTQLLDSMPKREDVEFTPAPSKSTLQADLAARRTERDNLLKRYSQARDQLDNAATPDRYLDAASEMRSVYDEADKRGGIDNLYRLQQADAAQDRRYGALLRGVDPSKMSFLEKAGTVAGGMAAGAAKQSAAGAVGLYQSAREGAILNADEGMGTGVDRAVNSYLGALSDDPDGEGTKAMRNAVQEAAKLYGGDDYARKVLAAIDSHVAEVRQANPDRQRGLFSEYISGLDLNSIERDDEATFRKLNDLAHSDDVYQTMFNLQDSAAADIQRGKDVMQSDLGDIIMDAGTSAIQSGVDALLGLPLGAGTPFAMAPFALRAYGGAYGEAARNVMQRGEEIGKEMAKNISKYAGTSAAIEVGTEMLWGTVGAMGGVTGGGALDDAITNKLTGALSRMAQTEKGAKILSFLGEKVLGGTFEGIEEVISDAANYILDTAGMYGGDRGTVDELLKNMGTSFATGAMSGLMGDVSRVVTGPMQNAMAGRDIRRNDPGMISDLIEAAQEGGELGDAWEKIAGRRGIEDVDALGPQELADSLTNRDIGKLYQIYEDMTASEDYDDIERAVDRLEKGKELTDNDVARIMRNKNVSEYLSGTTGVEISTSADAIEALKALASRHELSKALQEKNAQAETENAPEGESEAASEVDRTDLGRDIRSNLGATDYTRSTEDLVSEAAEKAQPVNPAESIRSGDARAERFGMQAAQKILPVESALERLGVNENARSEMVYAYQPGQNAVEYAGDMTRFYNQGTEGREFDYEAAGETPTASLAQARIAYTAGRAEYNMNTEEGYGTESETGEVRVRDGLQGNDGAGTGVEAGRVERGTGSAEFREEIAGFQGGRRLSGVRSGPVSASELGIRNGTQKKNIQVIQKNSKGVYDDKYVQSASQLVEERGYKFVPFVGGSLEVESLSKSGNKAVVQSRGYFDPDTKTIYVRADHKVFNVDQIARHELKHESLAREYSESGKEEVLSQYRDRMIEDLGSVDKLEDTLRDYYALYEGTGMSNEDIFEEVICDAAGNMNEFIMHGHMEDAAKAAPVLKAAKKAGEGARTEGEERIDANNGTGLFSREIRPFSEQEKKNWSHSKRIVIAENKDQIKAFVEDAISKGQNNKKLYFGKISDSLAERILSDTGIDVQGFNLSMAAYEMKKVIKDHGDDDAEAMMGQRAITSTDYENVPEIVSEYDDARRSRDTYNGKPAIEFEKYINGERMTVVGVVSDKRMDLFVQTMYGGQKEKSLATPTGEQAPVNTPEASSGTALSDERVSNLAAPVKKKFSMDFPVERTDRLIALHNMNEDAVRGMLELGGLAMPSVAITRADMGHNTYGPISAVYGRDSIDPKNRKNRIYGGDAWTPTFPDIGIKINEKASDIIRKKVKALLGDVKGLDLLLDSDNLSDQIERRGSFYNAYKDRDAYKIAFLRDTGRTLTVPMKAADYTVEAEAIRRIARHFSKEKMEEFRENSHSMMQVEPEIRKIIRDYYNESGIMLNNGRDENGQWKKAPYGDVLYGKEIGFGKLDNIMRDVRDYQRNGVRKVIDTKRLEKRLDIAMKTKKIQAEYEAWMNELGKDLIEKRGIRNNTDFFTPYGNRRSFEQLYYPYTLANIVRAMEGQAKQGKTSMLTGSGNIKGAAQQQYSSIEEARRNIDRLQPLDINEENNAAIKAFNDHTLDLCMRMVEGKGHSSFGGAFDAAEVLTEVIPRYQTADLIYRYLKREGYDDYYNVTPEIAKEIEGIIQEARKLPTAYFEGKMYRAVPINEALAYVVPDNMDKNLKQQLIDAGANVVTYKHGNDEDRLAKVNSISGARFSRDLDRKEELRNNTTKKGGDDSGKENSYNLLWQRALGDGRKITEHQKDGERWYSVLDFNGGVTGRRGVGLSAYDNEGRPISDRNLERLGNTIITDSNGHPIAAYHGSDQLFSSFEKGDLGFHLGSLMQADSRLEEKKIKAEDRRYYRAYIRMSNPIYFGVDYPQWNAAQTLQELGRQHILSIDDMMAIFFMEVQDRKTNKDGNPYAWKANETLRNLLMEKGYDGIIYNNTHEGPDASFLVFSDSQIVRTEIRDYNWKKIVDYSDEKEEHNSTGKKSLELGNTDLLDANRQLRKDLTQLRQQLKTRTAQKEYWKGQTKVTEGRQVRLDDAKKLARTIAKEYNAKVDADEVGAKMKALAEFCLNATEFDDAFYGEARTKAYEIAHAILDNAEILRSEGNPDSYQALRDYLRTTKLYVPGNLQHDLSEDYQAFRKRLMGTVTLTTADTSATGIDQAYKELQGIFGDGLFPDIAHPADQLKRILEILESFRPVYERLNSYEMADAVEWTANDILGRVVGDEIRQTDPTYADRMEARLKAEREKAKAALKQVREKRDQQVQALKDHYRQVAEDKRIKRADSEARTKLLKIARRLNNKHLTRAQRSLLDQYIGELDLVAKGITGQTIDNLRALQDWYLEQKENDPDFISDPGIEKMLQRLSKKHIKDMTQEEVADLTTVLLNIENEIRTERKLIESQERRDIYAAGMEVIDDVRSSSGRAGLLDKFIVTETLSPVREIRKLTGYKDADPLYTAVKELADGQRKMLDYQRRAEALFEKWTKDKKFTKRISGKSAEVITVKGLVDGEVKDVKITPAMRMALYLHSKNDANLRHISKGGAKIPDIDLYKKGKIQEAYDQGVRVVFTPSAIREITSHMAADERAFADAVSWYYNTMSRDSINETSELLKGFSIAGVEGYYPIDTDGSFLKKEFDAIKRDGSIEGMGILKERLEGAVNPIMLYDMNETLNKSISQNSKYYGLAIPVRNFNKLFNVTALGYETSVAETIRKNWAAQSVKYIEKMMADIQNGTGLDRDVWGTALAKARSKYAGAVLTTNASVAIKQTASYPTAASVVGYGPLIKALKDSNRKVDLDKVAKLTPLLWYRMKGFSNMELGDIGKEGGHIPKALNWIQGMDVWTTRKLWLAAEYYVEANNKDLERGTEAYDQAVAEIYNRIIEETQPNYTMMQRPQVLRSDSDLTRALNMFKTQPFQNFNILYDALGNLSAKSRQYKADGSKESLDALKAARKNAARAVSSQFVSAFVFALMQFAWDAFRGKTKKYEKDEDEEEMALAKFLRSIGIHVFDDMSIRSWVKGMGLNMLSSVGGMVPFGGYALELGEAMVDGVAKALGGKAIFDQTFYGMSENASESLNDMGKALLSVTSQITELLAGDKVDETAIRKLVDAGSDMAQFAGAPVSNWVKLAQSIARNVFLKTDGEWIGKYKALRVTTDPAKYKSDYWALLEKAFRNDRAAFATLYNTMLQDKDVISGVNPFETSSTSAKNNIDAQVKKWGYEELKDAWENRPDELNDVIAGLLNLPGDPFATDTKSAEDSINSQISKWAKEKTAASSGSNSQKETMYNRVYDGITTSALWATATKDQQDKVLEKLLSMAVADGDPDYDKNGTSRLEKARGGASVGLDETEYTMFLLALSMADPDGGSSPTNAELEAAINMVPGLTPEEKSYLWGTKKDSHKNDPWAKPAITRGGSIHPEVASTSNRPSWAYTRPKNISGQAPDVTRGEEGLNPYGVSKQGFTTKARQEFEQTLGGDVYRKMWDMAMDAGMGYDVIPTLEYIAKDREAQLYKEKAPAWVPDDYIPDAPVERLTAAMYHISDLEKDPIKKKLLEELYNILGNGVENGGLAQNSELNKLLWKLGF